VRHDGLAGVVVADSEYKSRVAFVLLTKLLEDFDRELRGTVTPPTDWSPLQTAIVEYRDPTNVDSISAIEKDLDEAMAVLAQTIENVLARGEKLDDLVAKSQELSAQSKLLYKHAANTNSCCIIT
jgi:synaptobrevin homolog YKT6